MPYQKKATPTKSDGKGFSKKPAAGAVRQGNDPRGDNSAGGGADFLKVDPNSYVDCTCLVEDTEIFSIEQCAIWLQKGSGTSPVWTFIGEDDPSLELTDVERRYRAFLPVLVDGEQKIFTMSKKLHGELLELGDYNNGLKGLNIRIKRVGASLQTRYSIITKGTRTDVDDEPEVDVLQALGPMDREGIEELLCKRLNASSFEEILTRYAGKKITRPLDKLEDEDEEIEEEEEEVKPKPKAKAKPKKAKPVVEEEEDDDLEL